MRRNPGYASAAVLSLNDDCTPFIGRRVRVVGQVEKVIGNILNMKQGEWTIKVELNENYHNEHYEFQFLEVMGPLEAIEDHTLRIRLESIRGMRNFSMDLYCEAVRRRNAFIRSHFM